MSCEECPWSRSRSRWRARSRSPGVSRTGPRPDMCFHLLRKLKGVGVEESNKFNLGKFLRYKKLVIFGYVILFTLNYFITVLYRYPCQYQGSRVPAPRRTRFGGQRKDGRNATRCLGRRGDSVAGGGYKTSPCGGKDGKIFADIVQSDLLPPSRSPANLPQAAIPPKCNADSSPLP